MARRQFGSIRKLPSGRWQAGYWHDGRRHTAPHTFRAKADAAAWLSRSEVEIERGAWVAPKAGRETVEQFAKRILNRRQDLSPTTRAKYEGLLAGHIVPTLGDVQLARLAPSAVRDWYHGLREARPGGSTADDAYRYLRAVCSTAVSDGLLARNPCQVKGAGQVRSAERPTASVAEVVAGIAATPERYRAAVALLAFAQLRRGEALGLTRADVAGDGSQVTVRNNLVQPAGQGPAVVKGPKTASGRRTLSVPGPVAGLLADHLGRFVGPEPEAALFTTEQGTRLTPRHLGKVWERVRGQVGLDGLHLHDLRHSGLTWLAASGASTREVMARGGHASSHAALGYQHSTGERDRALAVALGELMSTAPIPALSRPAEPDR